MGCEEPRYTFGDSDLAARRLAKVAEVFEPTTRAFLGRDGQIGIALAIDLGCGPGHTTRLIHETLRPSRALGLDRSRPFLELARASARPEVEFLEHDVTSVPFPIGPADLLFCRFLLTHLLQPERVVAAWATQLRPDGRLLVEEVESIETDVPALGRYLERVAQMLRGHGQRLEIGAAFHAMPDPQGLRRRDSRIATLAPPPSAAAEMFVSNVRVWGNEVGGLSALEADLVEVAARATHGNIEWRLRQIAFDAAGARPHP